MRCFQQSLYAGNLINQRNIRQECIHRRPGRLWKVCTVERVRIVKILNSILHSCHVSVSKCAARSYEVIRRIRAAHRSFTTSLPDTTARRTACSLRLLLYLAETAAASATAAAAVFTVGGP